MPRRSSFIESSARNHRRHRIVTESSARSHHRRRTRQMLPSLPHVGPTQPRERRRSNPTDRAGRPASLRIGRCRRFGSGPRLIGIFGPRRPNRSGNRIKDFDLIHQPTELDHRRNPIAFELAFPSDLPDNLANNLRQPPQRLRLEKRDVVGGRRQEVAALPRQQLQMDFERLSIKKNHRARIPIRSGVLISLQFRDEDLGRTLERTSIEKDFDVAATVPVFDRASGSGLRF